MALTTTDWVVIVGYLLINLLIGIIPAAASGNTAEFYQALMSWWLAGPAWCDDAVANAAWSRAGE
jgi:hypothetical protein